MLGKKVSAAVFTREPLLVGELAGLGELSELDEAHPEVIRAIVSVLQSIFGPCRTWTRPIEERLVTPTAPSTA